jgi:ribose-phosphate pyrophosphokinase
MHHERLGSSISYDGAAPLVLPLPGAEPLGAATAHAAAAEFGACEYRAFERGEHKIRPLTSVRGRPVAIVACAHGDLGGTSANDRLVQTWFLTSAVRDAGAQSVTVVAPYLPYARKDRRSKAQDPLGCRYVAQHFEATGADRILVVEPHNVAAFENAFRIEALALPFAPLVADACAVTPRNVPLVVVSPDVGGTKRAQQLRDLLAKRLAREVGLAFVEKQRSRGVMRGGRLVGEIGGADCVVVDDLVASGSTLAHAATVVRDAGARRWSVAVAHALLLPDSVETLGAAGFERVLVSDSVPLAPEVAAGLPIFVQPLGGYLGAVLRRVWRGGALDELTGIGD